MVINSTLIPAWLVGAFMVWAGGIWLLSREHVVRMDSRIFATTFLIWGAIYGIVYQFMDINVETRGFITRFMIIMVCLSQALPLTISYIRSLKRGE
jgi:hypothetical protein